MPLTRTLQKQVDQLSVLPPTVQLAAAEAVKTVLAEAAELSRAGKKGRTRKTVRGVKAKGREGVLAVRACLLAAFPELDEDDIVVQTTSVGGSDLQLSPKAKALFPFGIESKNTQTLKVWQALKQAEINARKKGLRPVLFFRRNNCDLHIAMAAADLFVWMATAPRSGIDRMLHERRKTHCVYCGAREASHTDFVDGVRGHRIDMPGMPQHGVWHPFSTDYSILDEVVK